MSTTVPLDTVDGGEHRPAEAAVRVRRVSKTFRIPHRRVSTLKERVLHPFQTTTHDEFPALGDISFEVADGEFFGIVGRNGSGKSTLLKCMAGIYDVDEGEIGIRGRVSPFIELGVGFNPDLTARDNVVINAVMLGLSRKQARERFDDVIAFAELEGFLDLKLKNYSSGMQVRLAFSTAIQVDADVLLIDEVLAVGDAAFQRKCFDQFRELKDAGKTIVFVSHAMSSVEQFCDRAMLIEGGEILDIGEPAVIARGYNEVNFGRLHDVVGDVAPSAAAEAAISAAWFEDLAGERLFAAEQGDTVRLCFEVEIRAPLEDPTFLVVLRNDARHTVLAYSSIWDHGETGSFQPGDRAVVRFEIPLWLTPARYSLSPTVSRAGGSDDVLDQREDIATLVVSGQRESGGIVDLPHVFSVERS